MVVQINGKVRAKIAVARDALQETIYAAAVATPAIAKFLSGEPKKVVFVPGRLMNIVL